MVRRSLLIIALCAAGCQRQDGSSDTPNSNELASPGPERVSIQTGPSPAAQPPAPHWTGVDDALVAPVWTGDYAEGSVFTPLWRGASSGIEDFVYAPPGADCRGLKGTVLVDWSKSQNRVHFLLKLRGLPPHPSVQRTQGVDWFPDPFHQAPKDIADGAYRFWAIFTNTRIASLYYDAQTLDLLGSEFEFPSGRRRGRFRSLFRSRGSSPTQRMRPDKNGFIIHEFDLRYDRVTVEGGYVQRGVRRLCAVELVSGFPGAALARAAAAVGESMAARQRRAHVGRCPPRRARVRHHHRRDARVPGLRRLLPVYP